MKLLGLTGGVGMGKSTAAEILALRGVPVIDTDAIARQVVEPGQSALQEIHASFGPAVIGADGTLQRGELARRVFTDLHARRQLEAILHPRIRAVWQARVESWRAAGRPCGVVVIPLLFETKADAHFQGIICVACSPATQRERLAARGWTPEQIHQRIQAQMSIDEKVARSDYVVWSEGTVEVLAGQLDRILQRVTG